MVSELILAFVLFAPLGIVLVELLGGAVDSLTDKEEKEKEYNTFMLKQEHTIGFCDGVMCVTKILENKENGDSNKHCVLTNGDKVRAMSDEELINLYFGSCDEVCLYDGNQCTDAMCREGMLAWLRKEANGGC